MIEAGLWRAAMWAGAISLDMTGCGPWMVSQPMVAGPILAGLLGQVRVGVIIGGIVQLLWMDVSPVGVGIPFDATAVTLTAIYWASLQPDCPLPYIVLALIAAVPIGYLFCWLDTQARRLNTFAARRLESVSDAHLSWALDLGIVSGLAWTWMRYFLMYLLAMSIGPLLLIPWEQRVLLPEWVKQGLLLAAGLYPMAGLGVTLELFMTEEPLKVVAKKSR